jgi:hypothetical protein
MGKFKTGPKKPKKPATAPPSQEYSIVPPGIEVVNEYSIVPPDLPRGAKPPTAKPQSPAYNCLFSSKQLTFYLSEINPPASGATAGLFVFKYAPKNVSWKKSVNITEYKTQGNIEQPLYFSSAANKKLKLDDIIFDGHDGSHILPHDQLNRLQLLQLPAKGTTKLRVFQLLVGNLDGKKFAARSYGKFVISGLDIVEQFRDPLSGLTLRAKVNLELTEVAGYQLDLGNDVALPTSIVPTLPPELTNLNRLGPTLSIVGKGKEGGAAAIEPGTIIAYVGIKGTKINKASGKHVAHLHMQFRYKNEDQTQAVKRYIKEDPKASWRTYPKEILDMITLGPWQYKDARQNLKSPALKLSEIKTRIGGGNLGAYRGYGPHRGVDYQFEGFIDEAMHRCPITTNIGLFWVGAAEGGQNAGAWEWEGTLNGKDFILSIFHIDNNGLAQASGTAAYKKNFTNAPLNTGGNTDKAIKKSGAETQDTGGS